MTIRPLELGGLNSLLGPFCSGATVRPVLRGRSLTRRECRTDFTCFIICYEELNKLDTYSRRPVVPMTPLSKQFASVLGQLVARSAAPRGICPSCRQQLSTTSSRQAGHNKWSKTKHIKAVTDKKKMVERTAFTKLITMYSRSMDVMLILQSCLY